MDYFDETKEMKRVVREMSNNSLAEAMKRADAWAQFATEEAILRLGFVSDYRDEVDKALVEVYKELIDKSWENGDTFEAYQNAWKIVERIFKVPEFDWVQGGRPRCGL